MLYLCNRARHAVSMKVGESAHRFVRSTAAAEVDTRPMQRPEDGVDDAHRPIVGHQSGGRVFVRPGHAGGAENYIDDREQIGEIAVPVLRLYRMMQSVILRIHHPQRPTPQRVANIHVGPNVIEDVDDRCRT